MCPMSHFHNVTNRCCSYAKHGSNSFLFQFAAQGKNFSNLQFGQLGARVLFSNRTTTAFLYSVVNIVLIFSKKEMAGIYAKRVIAAMKDINAKWNRAIVKLIRISMSTDRVGMAKTQRAVAAALTTSPEPTVFSFLNLFPKADLRRYSGRSHVAFL